ncbi:MAG TPA: tRNA uracil 4-sulfurtransferase ThiI [Polyangia bacterium]
MTAPMSRVILCRFGELFLKSGNRKRFEATLHRNMAAAIADVPGARVEPVHGRVLVHVPDEGAAEDAAQRLARVFGLVSISVASVTAPNLEAMAAEACAVATRARDEEGVTTFKIEARRGDKELPFTSIDLARDVGGRVLQATGLRVDVHRPQLTVGVEVTTDRAFVYGGERAAPGGLPVGVSGRGLVLLSGGIDSPVAAWLAAKRGLALDAVYFHSPPYIGEKSRDKVVALGKILRRWQALETITVVSFTETQKRLRDAGPGELAVVLYRRMMMRIADAIADRVRADALVTGENLGQVASQTVQNLAAIEAAARHLVLRPLVTYDKVDTTALARRIGTYETSILPFDDCCSLFLPRHPATAARPQDAEKAERDLDLPAEVAAALAASEVVDLRGS